MTTPTSSQRPASGAAATAAPTAASKPRSAATPALGPGRAYGLLALVILLWGSNWPIMKVGLESITPLWFGVSRMVLGAATLFTVLVITRRFIIPRRADWPVIVSVGVLQMCGFMGFVNLALLHVDAGRSAILAYTTPLWVTPAAVLLLGERLNATKGVGLALGLSGVAMLFNPLGFDWGDRDQVIGNAILMLSALGWAGAIIHVRAHTWTSSPLQLAPWQMLVALPVLLSLAIGYEGFAQPQWSAQLWIIILYNGVLATAFCFWAALTVTRSLPAISTSLGFLGVPVTGVVISALWLGEAMTVSLVGGLLLILAGMALVNLAGLRRGEG